MLMDTMRPLPINHSAVIGAACLALLVGALGCGTAGGAGPDVLDARTGRCTQEFGDPGQSLYLLPFPAGRTYTMFQGNCPSNPAWGHNGWLAYDFDMSIGDTVVASRAGTVSWVEQRWPDADRVCGHENGVAVTHDDATVMIYAHFTPNGARVRVGDRVTAGTMLGLSGDSGCSSGPHLHVNLLRNGTSWEKENTIPLNYRNADGPLTATRALVQGAKYTASAPGA
jgi:murein DD-endopeptidase MepM/ murein hydrolase activator NlpD